MNPPDRSQLAEFLDPDEEVLWATTVPGRRAGLLAVIGRLVAIAVGSATIGLLVSVGWAAFGPGSAAQTTDGPFRELPRVFPVAAGASGVLLVLLTARRLLRAAPPRIHAVSSRRALVVDLGTKQPRVQDVVALPDLTTLTRADRNGRQDLVWRVHVTSSRTGDSISSRTIKRFGFLAQPDVAPAEAAVLRHFAPPPRDPVVQPTIDRHASTLLDAALHPGETLLWAEPAEVPHQVRRWVLPAIAAVATAMLAGCAWLAARAWPAAESASPLAWVGVAAPAAFALLLVFGLRSAVAQVRHQTAEGGAYAVTDRRAVIAQRASDGSLRIDSHLPPAARRAEVESGPTGTTALFTRERLLPTDSFIRPDRFHGVRDVEGLRRALAACGDLPPTR